MYLPDLVLNAYFGRIWLKGSGIVRACTIENCKVIETRHFALEGTEELVEGMENGINTLEIKFTV